ncbi:MAG: GNAT family N-acetyltransferase [Anaerolineales bacterium]|nr:GNAT family N-acetyltransferase [Anaerolineales bacterium]
MRPPGRSGQLASPAQLSGWAKLQTDCGCPAVVPPEVFAALSRHGGTILGVGPATELHGAAAAFLGADARSDRRVVQARLKLHLALLLVHPSWRRKGIATALMQALRRLAEQDGLPLITWELDPLDGEWADLSLHRLGAVSQAWVGSPLDGECEPPAERRVEAGWWLRTRRVESRAGFRRESLALAHYLAAGAQPVNPAGLNEAGLRTPSLELEAVAKPIVLMEVPADAAGLARRAPGLAGAWRRQVNTILDEAFEKGYFLTDFLRLEQEAYPRAYHVLASGEGTLG